MRKRQTIERQRKSKTAQQLAMLSCNIEFTSLGVLAFWIIPYPFLFQEPYIRWYERLGFNKIPSYLIGVRNTMMDSNIFYGKRKRRKEASYDVSAKFMEMNMNRDRDDFSADFRVDHFPLGMAYVPIQNSIEMYDNLERAFHAGTIFPCLDKPFTGRRCVR